MMKGNRRFKHQTVEATACSRKLSECQPQIPGSTRRLRVGFGGSLKRTFHATTWEIEMSTITEIQEAIDRLPEKEKSALSAWLQSQDEPVLSESKEAALLASLDQAAAEVDAGKGIPIERVREKIRGWANYIL